MSLWSPEQERMLRAMGFMPYARAGAETVGAGIEQSRADIVAAASAPAGNAFGGLRLALRRAAGNRDVDALIGDLARLRKDPAGKRALWPKLRSLRRAPAT